MGYMSVPSSGGVFSGASGQQVLLEKSAEQHKKNQSPVFQNVMIPDQVRCQYEKFIAQLEQDFTAFKHSAAQSSQSSLYKRLSRKINRHTASVLRQCVRMSHNKVQAIQLKLAQLARQKRHEFSTRNEAGLAGLMTLLSCAYDRHQTEDGEGKTPTAGVLNQARQISFRGVTAVLGVLVYLPVIGQAFKQNGGDTSGSGSGSPGEPTCSSVTPELSPFPDNLTRCHGNYSVQAFGNTNYLEIRFFPPDDDTYSDPTNQLELDLLGFNDVGDIVDGEIKNNKYGLSGRTFFLEKLAPRETDAPGCLRARLTIPETGLLQGFQIQVANAVTGERRIYRIPPVKYAGTVEQPRVLGPAGCFNVLLSWKDNSSTTKGYSLRSQPDGEATQVNHINATTQYKLLGLDATRPSNVSIMPIDNECGREGVPVTTDWPGIDRSQCEVDESLCPFPATSLPASMARTPVVQASSAQSGGALFSPTNRIAGGATLSPVSIGALVFGGLGIAVAIAALVAAAVAGFCAVRQRGRNRAQYDLRPPARELQNRAGYVKPEDVAKAVHYEASSDTAHLIIENRGGSEEQGEAPDERAVDDRGESKRESNC